MENINQIIEILNEISFGFLICNSSRKLLFVNEQCRFLTGEGNLKAGNILDSGSILDNLYNTTFIDKKRIIEKFKGVNDDYYYAHAEPIFDGKEIEYIVVSIHNFNSEDFKDDATQARGILAELSDNKLQYHEFGDKVVAFSESFKTILKTCEHISNFDISVLITGESGTGKDVIARYIHEVSSRKDKPFFAINCAAIPEQLFETELFGYEKGTFSGQLPQGKKGVFETAGEGTLFLDEIGDMPLSLQAKLLRVLETHKFVPVGGTAPKKTNVRIISATNHDLKKMIDDGKFREDLYYRLNVLELKIPPLRERREDIIPLSLYFINENNIKYNIKKMIPAAELQKLQEYDWPGNVRQLKNVIDKMMIMSLGDNLVMPNDFIQNTEQDKSAEQNYYSLPLKEQIKKNSFNNAEKEVPLKEYIESKEKEYLEYCYSKFGSTRKMEQVLGVDHSTILRKIQKYNINNKKHPPKSGSTKVLDEQGRYIYWALYDL